jgi:CDP-glycerol glycerophosphotransferase (TagB/SpsB family)
VRSPGAGLSVGARIRAIGLPQIGNFRLLLITRVIQWPMRAVIRTVLPRLPRDRRLVAFGSRGGRLVDNSAYLFLHMSEHSSLRCVWVSESQDIVDELSAQGHEAVRRWSVRGIWVALRAKWYVYSFSVADINTLFSDGAVTFNLWHGVGVKRVLRLLLDHWKHRVFAAPEGSLTARLFADDRSSPDWLLTTSPMITSVFAPTFGIAPEQCVELGYPRNDHLVGGTTPPAAIVDREIYELIERSRPIVGYFPTWRDASFSVPGGAPMISEMAEIIAAQGGRLLFKAHDETVMADIGGSSAIILPKEFDLNAYLGLCDVLVSDFSSVTSDYLVLQRPIVLYCPDWDDFADGRGFNFDPAEMMAGVLTRTKAELYEALGDIHSIPVSPKNDELLERYWSDTAVPGASERLSRFIEEEVAATRS